MSDIALRPALRRSRWPLFLLVASLAVNAFFIGATATDFLRFGGATPARGRARSGSNSAGSKVGCHVKASTASRRQSARSGRVPKRTSTR